jgi:hypothetical protein
MRLLTTDRHTRCPFCGTEYSSYVPLFSRIPRVWRWGQNEAGTLDPCEHLVVLTEDPRPKVAGIWVAFACPEAIRWAIALLRGGAMDDFENWDALMAEAMWRAHGQRVGAFGQRILCDH